MTNPYRALITEMAAELDRCQQLLMDDRRQRHPLADHARAALAEPESIQARIAKSDAAIEASMERIRSLAAPARAALAKREHIFPTPSQAAECGGPCYEGNYCPEACDCGLYRPPALAEPEAEGPTDEEVEVWADQQGFIRGHGDHPCGFWIDDGDAGAFARAVLARWGRPFPTPSVEK